VAVAIVNSKKMSDKIIIAVVTDGRFDVAYSRYHRIVEFV